MHLYVHIPFCHRICPYCSFYKHTPGKTEMKRFIQALIVEAHSKRDLLGQAPPDEPRTLYLGGGTPSMLSNRHLGTLITELDSLVSIDSLHEFSFEANPATFTRQKIEFWKSLGMTRVSLGAQSWGPQVLAILGRTHSPETITHAVQTLREVGIPQINLDLMFSIPGQSLESWQDTLDRTIDAAPDHISAYNLTYEEDTEFFNSLAQGNTQIDPDHDAEYFTLADTMLTEAGFRHYETSNYARQGHVSQHNWGYWQGDDYVGIGPGAVSTIGHRRYHNIEDTTAYIRTTLERGTPEADVEILSPEDKHLERVALLLRTDRGVPQDLLPPHTDTLTDQLIQEGLARAIADNQGPRFALVGRGKLLVDEIVAELFATSSKLADSAH